MRFIAGVVVGLIVAPTVGAAYRKNQKSIDDRMIQILQNFAERCGMELYVSRERSR